MTAEAASALDIDVVVLAEDPDDAATRVASEVMLGRPSDREAMGALAQRCDVVTFDHELVDLSVLDELTAAGHLVRPGTATLALAVDKAVMRRTLGDAGLPMPEHVIIDPVWGDAQGAIEAFAGRHGWPVVLKAARGGYDGRAVWPVADRHEAADLVARADSSVALLVEEHVAIDAEIAVMVARRPGGVGVTWPAVETAQIDGVCREVLVPGRLDPEVLVAAQELAGTVAQVAQVVGVLAVELFLCDGRLLINEIAARPHNSGHWTIEGAQTSQFENHLRAVLDLPLGVTDPAHRAVAMVNIFGDATGSDVHRLMAGGLSIPGAHIHLYGKTPRKGRKLGHVTVCGTVPSLVRERAWAAARALGTSVPAGLELEVLEL